MAFSTSSTLIFLLFLFMTTTSNASLVKQTHLHFYFHEIDNTTAFVVASLHKDTNFGNILIFDNAIREGVEETSKLIGRAQGFVAYSSLIDNSSVTTLNILFNEGAYNGSSLSLLGRVENNGFADRTIVGGTGKFREARGYAISEVVQNITLPVNYGVLEFNVYVKLDM